MKKRILSILLCLAMLLTLVPTALAEEPAGSGSADATATDTESPFLDVWDSEQYYYEPVLWAADNGIVYGTDNTHFSPDDTCTRAQVVTFLYRAEGEPEVSGDNPFKDVSADAYYYDAVLWGYQNEIVYGTDTDKFSPDAMVTRAQFITFLWRYAGEPEASDDNHPFRDLPSDEYYTDAVLWGYENEIVYGTDADQFSPNNVCLRAQVVTFLYRYDQSITDDPIYVESTGGGTEASITAIEMEDAAVSVTVNVNSAATLKVEFLNEDTEAFICQVSDTTPDYCELVPVSIPVDVEQLPEYYVIRASLYDENGESLCDPFTTVRYTSAYAEFAAKTIYDFEDQTVLNFDDNANQNFGVLADDVKMISATATSNVLTEEYTTETDEDGMVTALTLSGYTIAQPDEQIARLEAGDIICMQAADGQMELFKIATIDWCLDGSYFLTQDDSAYLAEYYSFLNVDMVTDNTGTQTGEDTAYETANAGDSVVTSDTSAVNATTDAEIINVSHALASKSFSANRTFAVPNHPNWTASIGGTFSMAIEISALYDASLFREDYFEFSCTAVAGFNGTFEVKASNEDSENKTLNKEIQLVPEQKIPTPVTGLFVTAGISAPVSLTYSANLTIEYKETQTAGFKYTTTSGCQKVDKKERSLNVDIGGKAELSLGIRTSIGVGFLGNVIEADLIPEAGVKVTATADSSIGKEPSGDSWHGCTLCLDIQPSWYVKADAALKVHICAALDKTLFEKNLVSLSGNISKGWYISLINSKDSMFKGKVCWGTGECPNKEYRVTVSAAGGTGTALTSCTVTIKKQNGTVVSTGTAPLTEYLFDGKYTISAVIDGKTVSRTITVKDAAQNVQLTGEKKYSVTISAVDGDGNALTDCTVTIKNQDGTAVASGTAPLTKTLANGQYTASAVIDGQTVTKTFTVSNAAMAVTLKGDKSSTEPEEPEEPDPGSGSSISAADAVVGNYVTFGRYEQDNNLTNGAEAIEWLVLAKEADRALVISRYGLDVQPYNTERANVTWETCSLRSWLNDDFIDTAFGTEEQSKILTTTVTAGANPDYNTNPGNATEDQVFLLSIVEAEQYFISDEDRRCAPTAYAVAQEASVSNYYKTTEGKACCWWFLRSPGKTQYIATLVTDDGSLYYFSQNCVDSVYDCVRPAMWIKLAS